MRARALGLFCLVFLAHAYFAGGLGWNQSARVAATLTFVEPGPNRFTLRIDDFTKSDERNLYTGDWAKGADGHYYTNKAPGVSLIGIPVYAVLYGLEELIGLEPRSEPVTRFNTLLLNLWCSVAATAAASALLYLFLAARGLDHAAALVGALAYAFGTLVFPYDTSLWGHATGASCLLAALCLAHWPGGTRAPLLAGALGGLAVLVEYPALFGLAAVSCALLSPRCSWRQRLVFAAGAAPPLLLLALYQKLAFGGFLTTAISQGNPIFRDPLRAFGVLGEIDPGAVFGLLFSSYRGLFLFCPVLLFAALGGWQCWRSGRRMLVAACLAAFAASVAFVASFNAWAGGSASGARYLIVAIPLLSILAPATRGLAAWARWLYCGTLALSCFNMLAVTAVEVMVDENERNPLYGLAYRELLSGAYPHNGDTLNLGRLLGLAPPLDVLLFGLVFGGFSFVLLRRRRIESA
jgi:hypothetical protein